MNTTQILRYGHMIGSDSSGKRVDYKIRRLDSGLVEFWHPRWCAWYLIPTLWNVTEYWH